MEFRITNTPDPFTEKSYLPESVPLAKSEGHARLYRAILSYTNGEIAGRSVLISGHRGSGKTTLVGNAIQDVLHLFRDEGRRPLHVHVHGPDLLPQNLSPEDDEKLPIEERKLRNVMRQIAIALYRAVHDDFITSYRERVQNRAGIAPSERLELYELAAQFAHQLDESPAVDVLRDFWDRVGLLPKGVLFANPENDDQGMLEVVALSIICQAYQVVSGKWEQTSSDITQTSQSAALALAISGEIKNILGVLVGLITGGASAAVLYKTNPIVAVILGLLAAVVVSMTFSYSSSRSRERKQEIKNSFSKDRTVSSLGRMLPFLLNHMQRAGLYPIFVVDELDKVPKLSTRMQELITYLKFFVSDRAFFCFLTDRDYLEYLEHRTAGNNYAPEYSYFRDRIAMFFNPSDLRNYLYSVFDNAPQGSTNNGSSVERALFSYSLLHRSRLHPLDLRRQLTDLADGNGVVHISEPELLGNRARFELLFQLGIEAVLSRSELQQAIQSSPRFAQLACDVLYYPSRSWQGGDPVLDVSEGAILTYLTTRMKAAEPAEAQNGATPAADPAVPSNSLNDRDRALLVGAVLELVNELQDAQELVTRLQSQPSAGLQHEVLKFVPVGEKFKLLQRIGTQKYQWCFNAYGESTLDVGVEQVLDETKDDIDFILQIEQFLRGRSPRLTMTALGTEQHILSPTPPWPAVSAAIQRLRALQARSEKRAYTGMRDDGNAVWEYAARLRARGKVLAKSLCFASARLLQGDPPEADRLVQRLRLLSSELNLRGASDDVITSRIDAIYDSLGVIVPSLGEPASLDGDASSWIQQTEQQMNQMAASVVDPIKMKELYWQEWHERFSRFFQNHETSFDAKFADLWAKLPAAAPPIGEPELRLQLTEITVNSWSTILCSSLQAAVKPQGDGDPAWLAIPTMFRLGLSRLAAFTSERISAVTVPQISEWWTQMGLMPDRGAMLIVTAESSSITTSWAPLEGYPVLSVQPLWLTWLLEILVQYGVTKPHQIGIEKIAVELTGDPTQLLLKLKNHPSSNLTVNPSVVTIASEFFNLPCIYLLPEAPAETTEKLPYPFVVAPPNLDSVFNRRATAKAVTA